jgi:hypothetical protein
VKIMERVDLLHRIDAAGSVQIGHGKLCHIADYHLCKGFLMLMEHYGKNSFQLERANIAQVMDLPFSDALKCHQSLETLRPQPLGGKLCETTSVAG